MGKIKTRGNGEGTIYKRVNNGKTLWCMQYTLGRTQDGKLKRKTVYGKTREEVRDKYNKLLVELGTNSYVDKSLATFHQIAMSIIDDGYDFNKLNQNSYIRKKSTLARIDKHYISNMPIQKIVGDDIKDFLKSITHYANSTIKKIYGLCGATYRRALKQSIVSYNFFDNDEEYVCPKSDKPNKKIVGFSIEEHQKLVKILCDLSIPIKYRTQFLISLYTGMRMGEVNALTLDVIDLHDKKIIVNKTTSKDINDRTIMGKTTKTYAGTRTIGISDDLAKIIKQYIKHDYILNDENLLFYDKKYKYTSTNEVNMMFKRLCDKYNIGQGYNVNQHMLRHTFATRCIESGMPPNVLAKILGHADIRTTLNVYCDVFAEYEKEHTKNALEYYNRNNLRLVLQ